MTIIKSTATDTTLEIDRDFKDDVAITVAVPGEPGCDLGICVAPDAFAAAVAALGIPGLPTEPGLYVFDTEQIREDQSSAIVYRLMTGGRWRKRDRDVSKLEVLEELGHEFHLVRLIPVSDADL